MDEVEVKDDVAKDPPEEKEEPESGLPTAEEWSTFQEQFKGMQEQLSASKTAQEEAERRAAEEAGQKKLEQARKDNDLQGLEEIMAQKYQGQITELTNQLAEMKSSTEKAQAEQTKMSQSAKLGDIFKNKDYNIRESLRPGLEALFRSRDGIETVDGELRIGGKNVDIFMKGWINSSEAGGYKAAAVSSGGEALGNDRPSASKESGQPAGSRSAISRLVNEQLQTK